MRFRTALTFLIMAATLVFAVSAWTPEKPFTRDQVQGSAREGLGDESGAKLIEPQEYCALPIGLPYNGH